MGFLFLSEPCRRVFLYSPIAHIYALSCKPSARAPLFAQRTSPLPLHHDGFCAPQCAHTSTHSPRLVDDLFHAYSLLAFTCAVCAKQALRGEEDLETPRRAE